MYAKKAITLYWFASSAGHRTVGNLFGVARTTALKYIHRVNEALVENHLQEFVAFPSGSDLNDVIEITSFQLFLNIFK